MWGQPLKKEEKKYNQYITKGEKVELYKCSKGRKNVEDKNSK